MTLKFEILIYIFFLVEYLVLTESISIEWSSMFNIADSTLFSQITFPLWVNADIAKGSYSIYSREHLIILIFLCWQTSPQLMFHWNLILGPVLLPSDPVDPDSFLIACNHFVPEATLSIGWTTSQVGKVFHWYKFVLYGLWFCFL